MHLSLESLSRFFEYIITETGLELEYDLVVVVVGAVVELVASF